MQVVCVRLPTNDKRLYQVPLTKGITVGWLQEHVQEQHEKKEGWRLPIDQVVLGASRVPVQPDLQLEALCGKLDPNDKMGFLDLIVNRKVNFEVKMTGPEPGQLETVSIVYNVGTARLTVGQVLSDLSYMLKREDYACKRLANNSPDEAQFFAAPCYEVYANWIPKEERLVKLDEKLFALHNVVQKKQQVEMLEVLNEDAARALRRVCPLRGIWEKQPQMKVSLLMPFITQINEYYELDNLGAWLKQQAAPLIEPIDRAVAEGQIMFEGLWHLFEPGCQVVGLLEHKALVEVGFTIVSCKYINTWQGQIFVVKGKVIKTNSAQLFWADFSVEVPEYEGTVAITTLPLQRLDPTSRARLEGRGRKFQAVSQGAKFMAYKGCLRYNVYGQWYLAEASGRAMIDGQTHSKFKPNDAYPQPSTDQCLAGLGEHQLFCTWPFVPCFAFKGKMWGEALVEGFSEIEFRADAFERLVLEPAKKSIIQTLVSADRQQNPDLIDGKGCGSIFLLRGPPGTGKTLTAESLAEHLRRPLYAVSIGELGIDPQTMEKRLQQVLELGSLWNAVLLIDEVEVIAEARDHNHLERNALVCVVLRLIEYFPGVLFLTTNRAKNLDTAFKSRLSLIIKYPKMVTDTRHQIWTAQMAAAKIEVSQEELERLAGYHLNGREIQRIVRLARTVAAHSKQPCTFVHLDEMAAMTMPEKEKRKHD